MLKTIGTVREREREREEQSRKIKSNFCRRKTQNDGLLYFCLKNAKEEKGITLVVLAVTIVILIILSTVTISAVFGDGGLVEQAKKTREDAKNMVTEGSDSMNELLAEYANIMAGDSGIENPNINDIENPDPTVPEGWDEEKVDVVESQDGKKVPIPKGYVASQATKENVVNGGLVIYEGTQEVNDSNVATARTSRNQYVWVPVDDITKVAKTTGGVDIEGRTNYQGKLYNFSNTGATEKGGYGVGTNSYREPDIVSHSDSDNNTSNMNILGLASSNALKQQLQSDYNEIIASIDKYGGFYIGRYETGNLDGTIKEPVVVKGNGSTSNVNWYYMYRNIRSLPANSNVKTTMIYGSLWDGTLLWFGETNKSTNGQYGKSYSDIVNSSNWGNYNKSSGGTGGRQVTGNSDAWKANNIYDMAGNVADWTIEVYSTTYRITRGGYYGQSGSNYPSANRYTNEESYYYALPDKQTNYVGSRAMLWIVP